ncbi:hypothetical protein ABFS82_04G098600 [Erythranthe guttata]|uniref:Auxin-responsive protein n=1 Tax=Erythranthe guttata TaxID=4155 RepID=A0A022S0I2_ERYGU|nr:PREDICTED: auxin-responsive protein IAA2-like [Erythranthe guttata]XP_012831466.1 PREDICTED: auxin-responsive protein IAA2-like [Erythranthe guttata]EYU45834.1 hypothetical protein MIMGU_mgv1a011501mg [Erythranthe guttata]|eukprot:XP_012830741.1 PREDICTED: auxin-responsive protein IAA2-like [Erythranthe guttata]
MEGYSRKEKGWVTEESEKLELRLGLGPPGGDWTTVTDNNNINSPCHKNPVLISSPWHQENAAAKGGSGFLHMTVMKEPSQPCGNRVAAAAADNSDKNKGFSAAAPPPPASSAQKRTAPAPVVGWPPIRSFRKNLASGNSSKLATDSTNVGPDKFPAKKPVENSPKTPFVKINMDGIPIGRKVDLGSYDSYEKLSYGVDELFRGLLAAQSDSTKEIGGLLNGNNREYTLVYEDNEGDRMLVGDVPWHMFVSTVKRLRVLKSSELPTLSRGSKQGKLSFDA